jgi:exodeoxyribonuclease-1
MPFAFYDLETTGISPAYDQPLQFAAILTDDNFNPLKTIDIRCRLAPHILPSPYSLAVTCITPKQLQNPSLPSWFEFTQQVQQIIVQWAPATWVGYNSLKFDEEFLRQSFYQNLQPNIYETQFSGNDRLDILSAVYATWVRNPNILDWVVDGNERAIFKLDQLATANKFADHNAHDALGDVEATIHMAKCIRKGDPELWKDILSNRNKRDVLNKLDRFAPLDLIERFGGAPPRAYTGCLCGISEDYANSVGFFDLELADPGDYVDADEEVLAKAVSESPKIIRAVSINKVPSLFEPRLNNPKFSQGARQIASRPDFQKRVGRALANRFADKDLEERPVEKRIFDGFYSKHDKDALNLFQTTDWRKWAEIIPTLQDARLKQLAKRVLIFGNSETMTEYEQQKFRTYLEQKWHTPKEEKPEWTTFDDVERELAEIGEKQLISAEKLNDLKKFYEELSDTK